MSRLEAYYDQLAAPETDFRVQVCHTHHGKPVSEQQFALMVADLKTALGLAPGDRVLDLCCGNGLITRDLAAEARSVVGVDFSAALLDVARTHHQPKNTTYYHLDALALDRLAALEPEPFDKVVMHGALQHFRHDQLAPLLHGILARCAPEATVLLSYLPDLARRGKFYNTPRRKLAWAWGRLRGLELMGSWWSLRQIAAVAEAQGRRAEAVALDPGLQTAHYRFHARIS